MRKIISLIVIFIVVVLNLESVLAFEQDSNLRNNIDMNETITTVHGMNYINKSIDESIKVIPRSTFYGDCGSVVLTASGSLVTAVIRPDFLVWTFVGAITDSLTGAIYVSASNFDNSYSTYLTKKNKIHTLTLTGTATDVLGSQCGVVPGASISHYY